MRRGMTTASRQKQKPPLHGDEAVPLGIPYGDTSRSSTPSALNAQNDAPPGGRSGPDSRTDSEPIGTIFDVNGERQPLTERDPAADRAPQRRSVRLPRH
jgi:hypothetical protein